MAKAKGLDQYAQRHVYGMITSGNQIDQIPTAYTPKDRTGLVIHRVKYIIAEVLENLFLVGGDELWFGLCFTATGADAMNIPNTVGIIDSASVKMPLWVTGVPADVRERMLDEVGIIHDFSNMPGGGLLCHPSSLYAFINQDNMNAPFAGLNMYFELHYTTVDLSEDMYRELWEARVTAQTI